MTERIKIGCELILNIDLHTEPVDKNKEFKQKENELKILITDELEEPIIKFVDSKIESIFQKINHSNFLPDYEFYMFKPTDDSKGDAI